MPGDKYLLSILIIRYSMWKLEVNTCAELERKIYNNGKSNIVHHYLSGRSRIPHTELKLFTKKMPEVAQWVELPLWELLELEKYTADELKQKFLRKFSHLHAQINNIVKIDSDCKTVLPTYKMAPIDTEHLRNLGYSNQVYSLCMLIYLLRIMPLNKSGFTTRISSLLADMLCISISNFFFFKPLSLILNEFMDYLELSLLPFLAGEKKAFQIIWNKLSNWDLANQISARTNINNIICKNFTFLENGEADLVNLYNHVLYSDSHIQTNLKIEKFKNQPEIFMHHAGIDFDKYFGYWEVE